VGGGGTARERRAMWVEREPPLGAADAAACRHVHRRWLPLPTQENPNPQRET